MDAGDQWEDEPEGLAWGVEGMDFVDNEGLPEAEGGELAIEVDKEESDEEAIAEEVPPIEVEIEGVPRRDHATIWRFLRGGGRGH